MKNMGIRCGKPLSRLCFAFLLVLTLLAGILLPYAQAKAAATTKIKVKFYDGTEEFDEFALEINTGDVIQERVAPPKTGYDFVGWTKVKDASDVFDFDTALTEDTNFYAKYDKLPDEPTLSYSAHVQNVGWQPFIKSDNSKTVYVGTTGQALRLEALSIRFNPGGYTGNISVEMHVQNVGWQEVRNATITTEDKLLSAFTGLDQVAGSTGQSLRAEEVRISLTGDVANYYDVFYRVHVQNIGWTPWAKNGNEAGTDGISYRMEAIEIRLYKQDASDAPTDAPAFYSSEGTPGIFYQAKQAGKDWLTKADSEASAAVAESGLQIEQFKIIQLLTILPGDIEVSAHVQDVGWTDYVGLGKTAGTTGKRLEAVKIRLTGLLSSFFDVYYRVYVPSWVGWTGWTKNGNPTGTAGRSFLIEDIQVKLVKKTENLAEGSNQYFDTSTKKGAILERISKLNTGTTLKARFDWVVDNIKITDYQNGIPYADEWYIDSATYALDNKGGSCYEFAALFGLLADELGRPVEYHIGTVISTSGGRTNHAWVEIAGQIYDPITAKIGGNWYAVNKDSTGRDYKDVKVY
ncbi:MAG: InlB B-repeat-containing protein [Lachnospiraceae bacterium]|nr:InlB B-repeat-containing protein [Lachnospiraceae bacterium]